MPGQLASEILLTPICQVEQQLNLYRSAAEKQLRDKLIKIPNTRLQAALAEYNVRKEYLSKKKAELEARINADVERLTGQIVGAETEESAVDDSASTTHAIHDDEDQVLIDGENHMLIESLPADPKASSETVEGSGAESSPLATGASESTVDGLLTRKIPAYRYNGKTLDQWRDDSRYELMIGRRIDAINAFAVFGQSAMPREATEAIFDLAREYDLEHADSADLKAFRSAVMKGLRTENGAGISSEVWLPVLADRYASDAAKWKPLTLFLLSQLTTNDKAPQAALEKLEASDDAEIRGAAKEARKGRARPQGGQQMQSDPPRNPTGSLAPAGTRY